MWPIGTAVKPEFEIAELKPGSSYKFRVC
eukprot:SAG31_NODE_32651_length_353_cov_0.720472_1_plen_28_part_10